MCLKWQKISELESVGDHKQAVEAIQTRLIENPDEAEAVIRLGLNLWYALDSLPPQEARDWAEWFMVLFARHHRPLGGNADFCWAFGKGMCRHWPELPGASEALGRSLVQRAAALDPFWARIESGTLQEGDAQRLEGRGLLERVALGR